MAQSEVNVCNLALQRVGAATITSLTDNTTEARACNLVYESTRKEQLRRYPWNFAIARTTVSPDTAEPEDNYDYPFDYQFTLPAGCLRILRPPRPGLDWKIEGKKLLTNDGTVLYLRYVSDVEDAASWDASFYDVMAARLAQRLVEKLTNSNAKRDVLAQEYKEAVSTARLADAFESGPDEAVEDEWLTARI